MNEHLTKPHKQQIDAAITYINQGISRLSQNVSRDISSQQVEDLHDDIIDSLNAAICRLDPERCGK